MTSTHRDGDVFRYESYRIDPIHGVLTLCYRLGRWRFAEHITFGPSGRWDHPAVAAVARLVFLMAGVSYYKTAAPPVVDLGDVPVSDRERRFLRSFYLHGLGEFGYRNGIDLSGVRIEGGRPSTRPVAAEHAAAGNNGSPVTGPDAGGPPPSAQRSPGTADPTPRALVPFGGGIDSIVTVELVRERADVTLLVVARPHDRFEAIERPAAVTGLPILHVAREIDPQLLASARFGFLNGHVPVTGILSAIAVMAAALHGQEAVVMSNEWSASAVTLHHHGRPINHQYSKSLAFEAAFRGVLADLATGLPAGGVPDYFSLLRPRTELWIARRFAALRRYHESFRSCNRAFHIDPSRRLDHWCGRCDKCCFIDLILAPFLPAEDLGRVFAGREPLTDPSLADRFRALLGTSAADKPFECVGEVGECRAATLLAARRPDRADCALLADLAAEVAALPEIPDPAALLRPVGEHFIPPHYASDDLPAMTGEPDTGSAEPAAAGGARGGDSPDGPGGTAVDSKTTPAVRR